MLSDAAIQEAIEALEFIIRHSYETGFDPAKLKKVITALESEMSENRPRFPEQE
jgi:hypothetical protein